MAQYKMVQYLQDMYCDGCKKLLAESGTYSVVLDLDGIPVEINSEEEIMEDTTADYEMACECGVNREFHSPEDASQTRAPSSEYAKSPPVYRLF